MPRGAQGRARAAPLDLVERGQRLLVVLDAAVQHRALKPDARRARRKPLGGVEQFESAGEIAVGLLHLRPAVQGLKDVGIERGQLLVQSPRFLDAALVLQVPGEVCEQDRAGLRQ